MKKTESMKLDVLQENANDDMATHECRFTLLFNSYRGELCNVAFKVTGSKTIAEDIVHDVFLKLWMRRKEFNTIQQLWPYLYAMARNRGLDKLKRNKRETFLDADTITFCMLANDIEDWVTSREYNMILHKAVALMPNKQRHAFKLVKESGLTHKEAANILQVSVLTVKKHVTNALKFLSEHLDENEIELMKRDN